MAVVSLAATGLVVVLCAMVANGQSEDAVCSNTTATCRQTEQAEICSARGSCVCGACKCRDINGSTNAITGEFCECDNQSCPRDDNGALCSTHGQCQCGRCVCDAGWAGQQCGCTESEDACSNPASGEICSGLGECVCGSCQCFTAVGGNGGHYTGQFCQHCPTCPLQCEQYKDCVECLAFDSGPLSTSSSVDPQLCQQNCSHLHIEKQSTLNVDDETERLCRFQVVDSEGGECHMHFSYVTTATTTNSNTQTIRVADKLLDCQSTDVTTVTTTTIEMTTTTPPETSTKQLSTTTRRESSTEESTTTTTTTTEVTTMQSSTLSTTGTVVANVYEIGPDMDNVSGVGKLRKPDNSSDSPAANATRHIEDAGVRHPDSSACSVLAPRVLCLFTMWVVLLVRAC